jgi:hypothetical protein
MKIACMAAGGVGGYFGARLQQAGHDVTFFARGRHLEALRAKGLTIVSGEGNATLKVRALEDPSEAGVADVVLFAVKLGIPTARRRDPADRRSLFLVVIPSRTASIRTGCARPRSRMRHGGRLIAPASRRPA